ncbi:AMP-binding protein [Pseudonocardia hispaniensis]|uniref:AMP-binding protein n=1 Tax=Pseudonocardia hispaniensis TaxID=904933 RepID=A0ABW1J756_9PSEU
MNGAPHAWRIPAHPRTYPFPDTLNAAYVCVDQWVDRGLGDRVAYYVRPETPPAREVTFAQLQRRVVRFANALRSLGVDADSRVGIFLQLTVELPIAMLACARLAVPCSVIVGDRLDETDFTILVTQDEVVRGGRTRPRKADVDKTLTRAGTQPRSLVVLRRSGARVPMRAGRDVYWHDLVATVPDDPRSCPCRPQHPPHPVSRRRCRYIPDAGWVVDPTDGICGPLAEGMASVLHEDVPPHPEHDPWERVIRACGVNTLYASPLGEPRQARA